MGPRLRFALPRLCAVAAMLLAGLAVLGTGSAARADTPWGASGASYRSGVICGLPDGRRVALASWVVDGTTAFSTVDVVARGASYGPAPRSGATADLAAGTRGLGRADLGALAYLIEHAGTGTPAQVAETSALVAQAFGGGGAQQQCLGRQGTSTAAAAALLAAARRFAGPYTVRPDEVQAKPGASVPVGATVLSAAGVPTPGVQVSFAAAGAIAATAVTGADGRAVARLTVPAAVGTNSLLTATVAQATGLRLVVSRPAAVTLGAPQPVVGHAPVVAVQHPTPQLRVSAGSALVLAGGSLSPNAVVTGTYGYSGTGSVAVVGPAAAASGGSCSAADYAGAPTAWSGAFAFAGDGARPVGSTGALRPGCYAFTGSLTTTDATPAVTARAAADPGAAVGVSALQLTQSVGSGLARTGPLTASVTATAATGAAVSSTVTTYGPLAAAGGHCDSGISWAGAKTFAHSATVALAAQGGARLTAAVRTPAVTATGCYALVVRSTVTQAGRSAVVSAAPGTAGTTVLVVAPALHVTDSAYDGRQGVPMAGTVHVTGTAGLPASVAIGLMSAPAPAAGCHQLTFPTASASTENGGTTTVATTGDGDYSFRSPVPAKNRCYGVVATLAMAADATVQVALPPGPTSVFLAGAVAPTTQQVVERTASTNRPARELAVFGVTGAVVLVVALGLMIAAAVAGERKPDPRAGELLVEFSASA